MGALEQEVLRAILRRGNDAYGMEVREEIEARTGRPVSYGDVYTCLDRLEAEGYASSRVGEVTRERGGRARKYFRVEPVGQHALRATRGTVPVARGGGALQGVGPVSTGIAPGAGRTPGAAARGAEVSAAYSSRGRTGGGEGSPPIPRRGSSRA